MSKKKKNGAITLKQFLHKKKNPVYYDLFEYHQQQPQKVKRIIKKFEKKLINGMSYKEVALFLDELEKINYTFEYGLDSEPYALRHKSIPLYQVYGFNDNAIVDFPSDFFDL